MATDDATSEIIRPRRRGVPRPVEPEPASLPALARNREQPPAAPQARPPGPHDYQASEGGPPVPADRAAERQAPKHATNA
jgi:hypothetical protein